MQPGYVKSLIALLDDLGIEVPRNIRCDQRLTDHLIKAIQTAVDSTQAVAAKGNAVAADVMEGKTFSNAEAVNIVGTYVPLDTSDADATEDDIVATKTAYVNGEKLVGTNEKDKQYVFSSINTDSAFSAEDTAFLLEMKPGTHIVMAHGEDAHRFVPASKDAEGTVIHLLGGKLSSTGEATFYTMTMSVTEGIATITSVKTADGTEDITNWADHPGSLIMFK